jgi:hypothetical protein
MVFDLPGICLTMAQKLTYKEAAVPFTPIYRTKTLISRKDLHI